MRFIVLFICVCFLTFTAAGQWDVGEKIQAFLDATGFVDTRYDFKRDTVYCYLGKDTGSSEFIHPFINWFGNDDDLDGLVNRYKKFACFTIEQSRYRHIRLVFQKQGKRKFYDISCGNKPTATSFSERMYRVGDGVGMPVEMELKNGRVTCKVSAVGSELDKKDSTHYNRFSKGVFNIARYYLYQEPVIMDFYVYDRNEQKNIYSRELK